MRFIREFSYPDVFQRRIVLYNSFCVFMTAVYILTSFTTGFYRYAPYNSLFRSVILFGLTGFFLGNLSGKAVFKYVKNYRPIIILSGILYSICSLLYLTSGYHHNLKEYEILFIRSGLMLEGFLLISGFLSGIIMNYVLKILCGDFIDGKSGIFVFFICLICATVTGLSLSILSLHAAFINIILLFPVAVICVTSCMIKLPYNPPPIFAQEIQEAIEHSDDEDGTGLADSKREDLFFTYLNFTYVLIYTFFGFLNIVKFYGNTIIIQGFYTLICLIGTLCGFLLAKHIKAPFWHIYTEMLYPVFFIVFMALLYTFGDVVSSYHGTLLFMPVSILFGFSIYQTVNNIQKQYNHGGRFTILDFSLFILPFPILTVLEYMDFSYLWFFLLIYLLMLMNMVFPGIHLLQHSAKNYQKVLFFLFSLVFIPLIIFIHVYYKIPLNAQLYVRMTRGFNDFHSSNLDTRFIKKGSSVLYNHKKIFVATNSTVKNIQRSLVAAGLFTLNAPAEKNTVILIDGNTRFLRTPLAFPLESTRTIDYIPERALDFNKPAVSGKKSYGTERKSITAFLVGNREKFRAIVDSPNLYDQAYWPFRFSEEFYSLVRQNLAHGGLFVQILNINECRNDFLVSACVNLKKDFVKTAVFLFSDHIVLIASTVEDSLFLNGQTIARFTALFESDQDIASLFYNAYQPLTHMVYSDAGNLTSGTKQKKPTPFFITKNAEGFTLSEKQIEEYLNNNMKLMEIARNTPSYPFFYNTLYQILKGGSPIYSLLKATSYYESKREFEHESEKLFQLKKYAEYQYELRVYINNVLEYKKDFYYLEALRLEGDKQWENAGRLYRAILKIKPDDFEANYRLGILSITLQNLDAAFTYLQHAMQLKGNDPKVLYQMGVLLFSSGRTEEALNYFNRAIELNENTAPVFNYVGLCNEKIGNLIEAKNYYNRAIMLDPNDVAIKSNLERINQALEEEKNKWKLPDQKNQSDVEQGENIPLPINKSARDIRLKDKE